MPLDFTKPVQTRNGMKARIICTDRKINPSDHFRTVTVVYLVQTVNGEEQLGACDINGCQYIGREHAWDLVQAPDKALLDAAPMMLEALKKAINYQLTFEERHNAVGLAIALATGEKVAVHKWKSDGENHVYSRESARQIKIQGQR